MGGRKDGEKYDDEEMWSNLLYFGDWDNELERETLKVLGLGLGRKTIRWVCLGGDDGEVDEVEVFARG